MIFIGNEVIHIEIEFTFVNCTRDICYTSTYECQKCWDTKLMWFIKDSGVATLILGNYVSYSLATYIRSRYR